MNFSKFRDSRISRCIKVLDKSDRRKVVVVIFIQVAMGVLDLTGVALIGILGALAVSGVESKQPGNRVQSILKIINISHSTLQTQAAILGALAVTVLMIRTVLSVFFTKRILFFLSRRGANLSKTLITKLLARPLMEIQSRSSIETLFAVTTGVGSITIGVIGTIVTLLSDISLLLIMSVGLFVVDPLLATLTFIIFSIVGFILYRQLDKRVGNLGNLEAEKNIQSNHKILEVLGTYREAVVRDTRGYYSNLIGHLRLELSDIQAEMSFMPYISKYVIESSIVMGAFLMGGFQFLRNDATHAIATLSVFIAAGTRIAPAILRVQGAALTIRGSIGMAEPTLSLIDSLASNPLEDFRYAPRAIDDSHSGFIPNIELKQLSLKYPGKETFAVSDVTASIKDGQLVAVVGPSGAGKTSLIDILLGVISPTSGEVSISGMNPRDAIKRWPGAIAYVPQDIQIISGTIRDNLMVGFESDDKSELRNSDAIRISNLNEFVKSLPDGIDTEVGERGTKISGGQRQRLGIARAFYTNPALLVLDEATSALDGETESEITRSIGKLRGKVTIVLIAHRLSTVRDADVVLYMDNGKIISTGTFEEVRKVIPDFDNQAKLMGL